MRVLTIPALLYIFLVAQSTLSHAVEPFGQMDLLVARSYRPDLAEDILRRSTVRGPASASGPAETLLRPTSIPAEPGRRPASLPLPSHQPRSQDLQSPSSGALSPRILSRLSRYENHILRYSRMNGLEPNLVRAVIYVESSGQPKAVSSEGAQGLMQLMPPTAREMGVSNPFDPAQSIFGGTRYLGELLSRFGRLDLALWAYNAGPRAVSSNRLPPETKRFIPEILRVKSILDRTTT